MGSIWIILPLYLSSTLIYINGLQGFRLVNHTLKLFMISSNHEAWSHTAGIFKSSIRLDILLLFLSMHISSSWEMPQFGYVYSSTEIVRNIYDFLFVDINTHHLPGFSWAILWGNLYNDGRDGTTMCSASNRVATSLYVQQSTMCKVRIWMTK